MLPGQLHLLDPWEEKDESMLKIQQQQWRILEFVDSDFRKR